MAYAPTAARTRWLFLPHSVIESRHVEGQDPLAEPYLGGRQKADTLKSMRHIWLIEETKFAYRTMVKKVNNTL